jgi:hypothetical protein
MSEVPSALAVCDPRVVAGALFADEAAYLEKQVPLRVVWDAATLPILTHAAFLFDTILAEPVLLMGLKPILGHNYLELFGSTLKKVQECGFMEFDPIDHVPDDKRDHLKKLQQFLGEVHATDRKVRAMANDESVSLSAPVERALLYSRLTGLPYIGSERFIQALGMRLPQKNPSQLCHFTVLDQILSVELPNLRVSTLDDVLSLRSTAGASEFRKVMMDLVTALNTELLDDPSGLSKVTARWHRLKNEAMDLLIKEFRSGINSWSSVKAGFSVLVDIAGFIPGVSIATGVIAASKDTAEFAANLARKRKFKELGFISFLSELRAKSSQPDGHEKG